MYITLTSIVATMGQAIFYRQYLKLQPKFAAVYIISTFIATFIGIEVLVRNDHDILTRILGIILFITFLIYGYKEYIHSRKIKRTISTQSLKNSSDISTTYGIPYDASGNQLKLIKGIPPNVQKYTFDSCSQYIWLIIACLLSGFLRGLFGAGGPPMIIYFLCTEYSYSLYL